MWKKWTGLDTAGRTRRELRRGLTRDRLTQRAGRETHGGTRRHRASSLLVEARRNALIDHHDARDIATIGSQNQNVRF